MQTKANNYNKKYLNITENIQINESDIILIIFVKF